MKYLFLLLLACTLLYCGNPNVDEAAKIGPRLIKVSISSQDSSIIDRRYQVYLPPSYYKEKNQSYPVLYLMDGAVQFGDKSPFSGASWNSHSTMDSLVALGQMKEIILVGIDNAVEKRFSEYMPQEPGEAYLKNASDTSNNRLEYPLYADQFLAFLTKELKPKIDERYRTKSDVANTYIGGSSMGGLISMYGMCEYPDVFGGALCLSTHWIVGYDDSLPEASDALVEYFASHLPKGKKWYFDYGTEGLDLYYEKQQVRIDSILRANNYTQENWKTLAFEGHDHNEHYWRDRLYIPFTFAFAK
jgi:predicted alpha/beta superfamily hydrolase